MTVDTIVVLWDLPINSQEFLRAPQFMQTEDKAMFVYDHGVVGEFSTIVFDGVEASCFTFYECCSPEQVAAYDRVIMVEDSSWATELTSRKVSTKATSKHYRIFIDEVGCYDVLSAAVSRPLPGNLINQEIAKPGSN
ncbi:MAG: hypothetical protein Q8L45_05645 [Xanthomonadaceae bacterium]|nr:hypothetical protein [Xanthomonadaceae bacterium]MDP2184583.1 hypothetical protein [Xanthomonadales bacterium]MDZ4115909.1 hypothetical protein [Xanthomonadaceae bacterium]